jgi:outer membrane protein assembly factor BamB
MRKLALFAFAALCLVWSLRALADDWTMWGRTPTRNMVSPDKNPPTDWDVDTGKNIKWVANLGSKSYGNPIISNGIVYVGTNNENPRDPSMKADAGVLMAFRESDGKFLWQQTYGKLPTGRVNDWPGEGLCSTVYAEGNTIWYCTNRCDVICLDVSQSEPLPRVKWSVDMIKTLGVFPHNMTSCSIASWNDYIYVITANGVDETHTHVPAPNAPAIVCFDKHTGKVIWTDNSPGSNILHSQWASPAIVTVKGRPLVIAPLGDAWVYAFDAREGKKVWWFDTNLKDTIYPSTHNEVIATPVIVGDYMYIANGQDPEHGEGRGDLWCVDITRQGDVSLELSANPDAPKPKAGEELIEPAGAIPSRKGIPNPNSAVVWHYDKFDLKHDGKLTMDEMMHRTISTVAVDTEKNLVYAPDFSGFLHCLDARTGKVYWTHDMEAAVWGSPLLCDGKVFLGCESGDVVIFESGNTEKVIATHNMGNDAAVYCSPVFCNDVLYLMTRQKLFAISEKK